MTLFWYLNINTDLILANIILGNETCPQPQTSEHMAAIDVMDLKHIIILQNKIDLIKEQQVFKYYWITLLYYLYASKTIAKILNAPGNRTTPYNSRICKRNRRRKCPNHPNFRSIKIQYWSYLRVYCKENPYPTPWLHIRTQVYTIYYTVGPLLSAPVIHYTVGPLLSEPRYTLQSDLYYPNPGIHYTVGPLLSAKLDYPLFLRQKLGTPNLYEVQ